MKYKTKKQGQSNYQKKKNNNGFETKCREEIIDWKVAEKKEKRWNKETTGNNGEKQMIITH